jgi:predicted ArsR family transcriptional regulator
MSFHASARSHPTRVLILAALERHGPMSPTEAAALPEFAQTTEAEERTSRVSYHFKYLRAKGLIEIVKEEKVRGAIKTTYALTERGRDIPDDARALDRISAVLCSGVSVGDAITKIADVVAATERTVT